MDVHVLWSWVALINPIYKLIGSCIIVKYFMDRVKSGKYIYQKKLHIWWMQPPGILERINIMMNKVLLSQVLYPKLSAQFL